MQFDVVIAGAGPAGSSTAINLARQGFRVAIVEQKKFPRAKLCGEFISPECLDQFSRLGVLERMYAGQPAEITETIFYSAGGAKVAVPSEWFGFSGIAMGLSRAEMDNNLLDRARECGVTVFEDTIATGLIETQGRIEGVLTRDQNGASEIRSRMVVDATGRSRVLARRIEKQANKTMKRSNLVAFKAHFENTAGPEGVCEIYFYHGGYGGLNFVEGGFGNLCFIAEGKDVRRLKSDPTTVMREILMSNGQASKSLANAHQSSEWLSVALESFGRRDLVPATGLIAVGDAASFIDPFTGSGMLMALESGDLASSAAGNYLRAVNGSWAAFASDYRSQYARKFNGRLRVCSYLRRAAFIPGLASAAITLFGTSTNVRRRLARATRSTKREKRPTGSAKPIHSTRVGDSIKPGVTPEPPDHSKT